MVMADPAGIFALVGLLFALFASAIYAAYDAYRFRDRRRLVISAALAPVFGAAAVIAFWFAQQNPGRNLWGGAAFGPGWECSVIPYARVCFRDVPPALDPPALEPPKRSGG